MDKKEILKKDSYIVDCFIKVRDGDNNLFHQQIDGKVTAKLNRYAVIPIEQYIELLNN